MIYFFMTTVDGAKEALERQFRDKKNGISSFRPFGKNGKAYFLDVEADDAAFLENIKDIHAQIKGGEGHFIAQLVDIEQGVAIVPTSLEDWLDQRFESLSISYTKLPQDPSFEDLIGLDAQKNAFLSLLPGFKIRRVLAENGFGLPARASNFVLCGPSGTGKSDFARAAANLLKGDDEGRFVHVLQGRNIANLGYEGEKHLEDVLEQTDNGVLIIEDINLVLREDPLERANTKDKLIELLIEFPERPVVIGTTSQDNFLPQVRTSPELMRLFPNVVSFAPYGTEELVKIFKAKVSASGLHVSDEASQAVLGYFLESRKALGSRHRNGWEAVKLLHKAVDCLAQRLAAGGESFELSRNENGEFSKGLQKRFENMKLLTVQDIPAFRQSESSPTSTAASQARRPAGSNVVPLSLYRKGF